MFDQLQKRLSGALQKVRGRSKISEADVDAVLSEIRTGLLEADVHFRVAKDFLARVKESCLHEDVIKSLSPEQQILKVLHKELVQIFGSENRELKLDVRPPACVLVCGLQGSGKTTSTIKLALWLKNKGRRVGVVSTDTQRPAAMEQLAQLAEKNQIPCLRFEAAQGAVKISEAAFKAASDQNLEVLLVDTAGRLQVDSELMKELQNVSAKVDPIEKILVIDSMMGQQAVEVAEAFDRDLGLTGSILTKLDGDARGGAALSIVSTTGKPIKFIGTGERALDFEAFYPDRMASRLLDMGDVMSLIEKAQMAISEEEAANAAEKLKNMNNFTLEDFREQLKLLSRMGPLSGIMKMLPGMGAIQEQLDQVDTEKEMSRINAIINSMTQQERRSPDVLNGSRRARIAKGSGTQVNDVNQFIKRFLDARKMMKKLGRFGGLLGGMGGAGGGMPGAGMGSMPNPFAQRKGGKGFGRKF
ncbi:MAG: signal recognition particle protein [Proteobacteria bacterium]|nr:signal recognition particle protein [Pseudomonadota bacterium]